MIFVIDRLKIRGHSILWDVEDNIPTWVTEIQDDAELRQTVKEHVEYMVNITKDK